LKRLTKKIYNKKFQFLFKNFNVIFICDLITQDQIDFIISSPPQNFYSKYFFFFLNAVYVLFFTHLNIFFSMKHIRFI